MRNASVASFVRLFSFILINEFENISEDCPIDGLINAFILINQRFQLIGFTNNYL